MEKLLSTEHLLLMLFVTCICWCLQFYIKRRRLYKLAAEFNGPPSYPLIGNILQCLVPLSEMVDSILESTIKYKSPQRVWFGTTLVVHVFEPEDVEIVLNSPHALNRPSVYKMLEVITGPGLGTAPAEEWKRRRRLMSPVFNQKVLDQFFDLFYCQSKKLADDLSVKAGKGIFDVQDDLIAFALDNVLESLLDFNKDDSKAAHNMSGWLLNLIEAITLRTTNILYFFDFTFKRSSSGRKFFKSKAEYDKYIDKILERWTKDSLAKVEYDKDNSVVIELSKPKKLIEHLIAVSDGSSSFTNDQLRGEVNSFIIAGVETTSTLVGYLLILLAMHPDIQEKVYQEVKNIIKAKQHLELNDLKELQYLEQVIKEGLRLFPPIAGLGRLTDQEVQLTKHTIPANTTVIVGLLALHRNPDVWPDPSKFDPDRFAPEEVAKRHPYSWIAFSGGPRNCIGLRFAWLSIKVAMAVLISRYTFGTDYKSVEDIHLSMMHKLQPTKGFRISLTERKLV